MTQKKKNKTAEGLSLAVIIGGCMVIFGWISDIGVLKSLSPSWVSMKLATAISFVLSGITLYSIVRAREGEIEKAQVALSLTSLILVLLMGTLFFSALLKIHTGVENLFVHEWADAVKTAAPGRPSIPTMLNFLLIASAGVLTLLNPAKVRTKLRAIGLIVGAIGALAVVGYILNAPLLYYFREGISSGLALHTALLFILLGIGLLCL